MPLQSPGLSRKSAQQLIHASCNALPVQLQVAKYVVLRPMPKAQRQMTHTTLTLSSVVVNRSTAKYNTQRLQMAMTNATIAIWA